MPRHGAALLLNHLLDGTVVHTTAEGCDLSVDMVATGTHDPADATHLVTVKVTMPTPGSASDAANRLRRLTTVDVWADDLRTRWHFDPIDDYDGRPVVLNATAPVTVPAPL